MRKLLGLGLFLCGLAIAAYPSISVMRLQQQVLDEVPLPPGSSATIEGTTEGALSDDDFVLAFRGTGASIAEVEQTLLAAGFERGGPELEGRPTFTRECCGTYEAVVVAVFEGRDGFTGLRYSVTDTDITVTRYFITGLGMLLMLVGAGVAASSSAAFGRRSESTPGALSGHTSTSAS